MIIKSITSKSGGRFLQLLNYLTQDESKTVNERGESFVLTRFLNGKTNEQMAREFAVTEAGRLHQRANNTKMVHEIISFSDLDKDKINIEHLQTLTEAYLERRSPLMQAYVIGHFNENHYHCHIVSSPVEIFTGRSLRMSKAEFAVIKQDLQKLQMEKFPELSNSIVEHGRKAKERSQGKKQDQIPKNELTMAIRNPNRVSDKARAREAIESCMIMAESKASFYELLSQEGFMPYHRGNEYKGISDGIRNYRFATLINDYAARFNALDEKQERLEDLRDIRNNNQEREHEHEMERSYRVSDNQNEDYDDTEESNDRDDTYTR